MATSSRYNPALKQEWEKIDETIRKFSDEGNRVMVEVLRRRRVELARIFDEPRRKRMRLANQRSRALRSSTSDDSSSSDSSSDSEWEDIEEDSSSEEEPEPEPHNPDNDEPFFQPDGATRPDEGSEGKRLNFRRDVTVAEMIGALIMLKTSHKVSWTLFLSIVALIQGLLVANNRELPMTMRSLKRFFKKLHGIVPKRILFCTKCEHICSETDGFQIPKNVVCDNCDRNVSEEAKAGRGSFIYIPTIPQLKSMVRNSGLYEVVENSKEYLSMFFRGDRFQAVLNRGNIPVMLGSDEAPITKSSSKCVYPIVMSLGNIPNFFTERFAVVCALFAGSMKDVPPAHIFYERVKQEIEFFLQKPFKWTSSEKKSLEIVAVGADAPEMRKLANQATSGYRSCLYCLVKGQCWD
jgi:hypothetical protein